MTTQELDRAVLKAINDRIGTRPPTYRDIAYEIDVWLAALYASVARLKKLDLVVDGGFRSARTLRPRHPKFYRDLP